jgi:hypothetical protein
MALFAITCPHCRKQGKGPIELNGQKIRCRNCGRVFLVQLAKKPVPAAQPPAQAVKAKAGAPPVPVKGRPAQPPARPEPQQGPGTYAFAGEGAAPAAEALPPVPELGVSALDDEGNPYDLKDVDLARRCPYCAEAMDEEDIICINCGYNTQTRRHQQTQRTYANTPGDIFKWLLSGILCVLGIFALIGFDVFWWFGLESSWWKEVDSWEVPNLSYGIRVWGVVVSLYFIYIQAKFAFKRLILHPTPPEVEKLDIDR